MKISCIVTVLNEESTITGLLDALTKQTLLPDEIVIVDGGSTDQTVSLMENFRPEDEAKTAHVKLKIIQKAGNRSIGRNEAVRQAEGDIIVCTDAGCMPEKHWIEHITQPFVDKTIDVVAGYYESRAHTVFQECLVPYVFVMPDKIKPQKFLPASRSMAFRREIWEKAGGFPEQFAHNEDYVFAHTLKRMGAKIWFRKEAIVYWIPRETFAGAFNMFYRFAYGDIEAGLIRPKVLGVIIRYILGIIFLFLIFLTQSLWLVALCVILLVAYVIWAIVKSYRYIDDEQALYLLPMIQFTADAAVLLGSLKGAWARIWGTRKTS
jgi:glycosyltransferase involved in cell wall biosynthesis